MKIYIEILTEYNKRVKISQNNNSIYISEFYITCDIMLHDVSHFKINKNEINFINYKPGFKKMDKMNIKKGN